MWFFLGNRFASKAVFLQNVFYGYFRSGFFMVFSFFGFSTFQTRMNFISINRITLLQSIVVLGMKFADG